MPIKRTPNDLCDFKRRAFTHLQAHTSYKNRTTTHTRSDYLKLLPPSALLPFCGVLRVLDHHSKHQTQSLYDSLLGGEANSIV